MSKLPQLSDEAWEFIKKNSDGYSESNQAATFEGDWGNWNWLIAEIVKRCEVKKEEIPLPPEPPAPRIIHEGVKIINPAKTN
jgi:hypothetical protein